MQRNNSNGPVAEPVSEKRLTLFQEGLSRGPRATPGKFRLDFIGTKDSPWNKAASEVFAESFVESGNYQCNDQELIANKFRSYIRTLASQYAKQVGHEEDSGGEGDDRKPINRAKGRARTVSLAAPNS